MFPKFQALKATIYLVFSKSQFIVPLVSHEQISPLRMPAAHSLDDILEQVLNLNASLLGKLSVVRRGQSGGCVGNPMNPGVVFFVARGIVIPR